MANTAQAKKRARQSEVRREHNTSMRSQLRTSIKKIHTAIASNDQKAANDSFREAQPIIDRMAGKGIIHKNKAARHKSRLNTRIKKMVVVAASV